MLRRSLSRLSKLFRGADRVRPARKAPRLQLESLGDRTLPAILFTPLSTNPVVTDGGGDVLENAPVYLIYWGSAWGQPGNNPTLQSVNSAVSNLLGSPYLASLPQYRSGLAGATFDINHNWVVDSATSPPNGFTATDLGNEVMRATNQLGLPDPDANPNALYLVITPPGVESDDPNAAGYHTSGTFLDSISLFPPVIDFDHIHYGWVGNDGGLDSVTEILSHELVESVTDADPFGAITATVGGDNELSDGEAQHYAYRLNGTLAQSYWSASDHAYVVPTGQQQNFFVNNGVLTVRGDQLANTNDTIFVTTSPAGGVRVILNGEVATFEPGQITGVVVNAGQGSDIVDVGNGSLDPLKVPVTVDGGAGTGTDTLIVDDSTDSAADGYSLTGTISGASVITTVTRSNAGDPSRARTITYSGVEAVSLSAGAGSNAVTVGSGNLDLLPASVRVSGGAGSDSLTVNDNLRAFSDGYAVTGSAVVRTTPFVPSLARTVNYSGVEALALNAQNGNNAITVGTGNLDFLPAAVSINGGLGSDTLTVDDSGSPSTDSYTVSGSAVKRTGTTLPRVFVAGTVGYVGVEAMTLLAESGANTITVTAPVPTFPVTIDAGGGTDTLVGPNATNLWQVTGADSGSVGAVTFRAAERLTGGSGNDTFRFGALAGSVGVAVNGGAGRNALDYSLLGAASPIFVDLSAGQASRVAGSAAGAVSNIQDVTGGAGADTILGSAANNILRGGGGNDVLRGGPGNDVLIGGAGDDLLEDSGGRNLLIGGDGRDVLLGAADDDILIGGSTSFDAASAADDASLTSVVAEWTSARAYADRVANLRGTGLGPRANGSVFLKSAGIGQTVFSDTFADALTGGAGMDWFFDAPPDTTDAVTGELHN